jgi:hypothetical protein
VFEKEAYMNACQTVLLDELRFRTDDKGQTIISCIKDGKTHTEAAIQENQLWFS